MSLHSNRRAASVVDLVGDTPLIRLRSVEERAGGGVEIWAKCEFENPGGSVKDRAARQIMLDALADGRLAGKRLIDSTSGNTGVAYSMIGAALGIPVTLVMPANVSVARMNITRAYGTELVFSSEMEGSDGALVLARQMVDADPEKYFYPNQYASPSNPKAHYLGTGAEILRSLGDRLTHFVAGIGTTGTIMGTGRRLKEHSRSIQVVAVEPDDSFHGLEGLKHLASSLVPPIWQPDGIVDRCLAMGTDQAWEASDSLCREEGVFVGHSAGANVAGACEVARQAGRGAVVVTVLPDRGDRYFAPMKWERQYVW